MYSTSISFLLSCIISHLVDLQPIVENTVSLIERTFICNNIHVLVYLSCLLKLRLPDCGFLYYNISTVSPESYIL